MLRLQLLRAAFLVLVPLLAADSVAADVLAPASQRFAAANGDEVPSFQRHVVPLMGRLGCNGRACHGSFQGQGGFRLSLFGYDFKSDHDALLGGEQPRVNLKSAQESKFLLKPTRSVPHKGGQRLEADSWQYHLLQRWIQAGAPPARDADPRFATLEVEPSEIVFRKPGETARLKVIAHWADGAREDVTPLSRFRSNDEATATVDASGQITVTGKGGTDIVAFYDNGVVPVSVIVPVSDKAYPEIPTSTKIDELVVGRLRKLGIVPSELCNDEEFLRRVSLDLTGTLPTPDEVLTFRADKSADRRARKIDELLSRPTYSAWWATRLCDFMGNSDRNGLLGGEAGLNREKARQWYHWVERRVRENVSYDKLVEGMALAIGKQANQSYDDYCAEMSSYFRKEKPADFTARETMPFFWARRTFGKPEEQALSFAHAFLGVNLQCAQCHKHPYDQWTKQDFDQFTAFFIGVRYSEGNRVRVQEMKKTVGLGSLDQDSGEYKRKFVALLQEGKILPFKELTVPINKAAKNAKNAKVAPKKLAGRVITPKLLGGDEVVASKYADPRQPLMDWMRQEDHPYFARALVNRVWAGYFNVGLIDPPDDLNLANPPSNPALLDHLTREFIGSGYDLKWLHRTITTSHTYQRSWRPNDTNKFDERNFSHSVVRRLPAEVVYDAIVLATASDDARKAFDRDPAGKRAIGVAGNLSGVKGSDYAVNLFGKPPRSINCDCERSSEPSLLQTVYLRNDQEVLKMLDRPDGWLKQVARVKKHDPEELVRQTYLRTLNRLPLEREAVVARKHLEAGATTARLKDLLWALINTKEFVVNR